MRKWRKESIAVAWRSGNANPIVPFAIVSGRSGEERNSFGCAILKATPQPRFTAAAMCADRKCEPVSVFVYDSFNERRKQAKKFLTSEKR